jgi:hypothetical protein
MGPIFGLIAAVTQMRLIPCSPPSLINHEFNWTFDWLHSDELSFGGANSSLLSPAHGWQQCPD